MKNKYKILSFAFVVALVTLACGVDINLPENAIEVDEQVIDEINVPLLDESGIVEVTLNFGAGEMLISSGADGVLIEGTATYNIEEFRHQVTTSGNSITLDQGTFEYDITGLPNFNDVENIWDLRFGSTPNGSGYSCGRV